MPTVIFRRIGGPKNPIMALDPSIYLRFEEDYDESVSWGGGFTNSADPPLVIANYGNGGPNEWEMGAYYDGGNFETGLAFGEGIAGVKNRGILLRGKNSVEHIGGTKFAGVIAASPEPGGPTLNAGANEGTLMFAYYLDPLMALPNEDGRLAQLGGIFGMGYPLDSNSMANSIGFFWRAVRPDPASYAQITLQVQIGDYASNEIQIQAAIPEMDPTAPYNAWVPCVLRYKNDPGAGTCLVQAYYGSNQLLNIETTGTMPARAVTGPFATIRPVVGRRHINQSFFAGAGKVDEFCWWDRCLDDDDWQTALDYLLNLCIAANQ